MENAMNIQWYPGHMAKTRRMIVEQMKRMDAVCEILDARIPLSSRNPDVEELTGEKPRLIVLNRADLADPAATRQWAAYFRGKGYAVLEANAKAGQGTGRFAGAVRELLAEKIAAYTERGQAGRTLRVMILGIPNVGKSTFINKVSGRKTAKAEDRPGVTRSKQWIAVDRSLELLDTPGMLWPKFDDPAGTLCFVEVKTRTSSGFAQAREAVTPAKQRKLRAAASLYLAERRLDCRCRFDVAEVYWTSRRINYIINAF